jgi:hypothetical protein
MDDALRAFVGERAGGRCEYCQLHQDEYEYQALPIEQIIAKQHGGAADLDNLSLGVYGRRLFRVFIALTNRLGEKSGLPSDRFGVQPQSLPSWVCLRSGFKSRE